MLCLILLRASTASSQIFTSNGALVSVSSGAIVKVVGSLWNRNNGATAATLTNTLGTVTITEDFTNDGLAQGTQGGGSGTYFVAGHWINNAIWAASTGTVGMNSSDSQHFKGTQVTTFNNLLIQAGGLKRLLISERVDGVMNFTSGVVYTTESFLLTHTVNGSWTNGLSAASYIDGPAAKDFPDVLGGAFRYNIGKFGRVNTSEITPMSSSACTWRTEYFPVQFYNVTDVIPPIRNISRTHYWHGDRTVGSTDAQIRLYWIAGDYQATYITDPSKLVVARWTTFSGNNGGGTYPSTNAGAWQNFGNTSYNGNVSAGNVRSFSTSTYPVTALVTSNQPWTIADTSGLNGLPVELSAFTAHQVGSQVKLEWKTESESDNAGFEIERRAPNGSRWLAASYITDRELQAKDRDGASYHAFDTPPAPGRWSYDLIQRDLDGTFTLVGSQEVAYLEYVPPATAEARFFPNPSPGAGLLEILLPEPCEVSIRLFDVAGRLRSSYEHTTLPEGRTEIELQTAGLSNGSYTAIVKIGARTIRTSIVILR